MRKIDWLGFETSIRSILKDYRESEILGTVALRRLDDLLADTTGRGNELPETPMLWESSWDLR